MKQLGLADGIFRRNGWHEHVTERPEKVARPGQLSYTAVGGGFALVAIVFVASTVEFACFNLLQFRRTWSPQL